MSKKLVIGVGINDSETPVLRAQNGKAVWLCQFYLSWRRMLERCYSSEYLLKKPTYSGCSVAPEWLTFSVFREWMQRHDWEGKHLDKDIIFPGNKVYSPETCVFVSPALNAFLNENGRSRGQWPLGVYWHKQLSKFTAQCSNPFTGKKEYLGMFICPNEAHEEWRKRKREHANRYADMQTDARIARGLRARFEAGHA